MGQILTQAENPNGLHQRYYIKKVVKNEIEIAGARFVDEQQPTRLVDVDPEAEYFVLRLDEGGKDTNHIRACRIGVHAYADAIEPFIPQLAKDLREKYPLL